MTVSNGIGFLLQSSPERLLRPSTHQVLQGLANFWSRSPHLVARSAEPLLWPVLLSCCHRVPFLSRPSSMRLRLFTGADAPLSLEPNFHKI